jgi:hypothetical protein
MNEVAKDLIAQLVDELQATKDALKKAEESVEFYKTDSLMWYDRWEKEKTANNLSIEKMMTPKTCTEDLNNG